MWLELWARPWGGVQGIHREHTGFTELNKPLLNHVLVAGLVFSVLFYYTSSFRERNYKTDYKEKILKIWQVSGTTML